MKRTILFCFAALSLVAMPCLAQNPLREEILSAKTVFLAGGTPDLFDIAAGELKKWGRFQVVASRSEADVVFDFGLDWKPGQGFAIETLAITDARSGEMLYWGDRVGHFAPWSRMMRSLLQDLRKRIEATESARTLEYTIQFATRAAKYFTDAAALDEKLAAIRPSTADSLKKTAMNDREYANLLTKWSSRMAQFLANATADALIRKHNAEITKRDSDENLAYTCSHLALRKDIERFVDAVRASLPPDVVQALDTEAADEAALSADCSSEQAKNLLEKQAK